MKNTGQAFFVDVGAITSDLFNIPAFTSKLYWDFEGFSDLTFLEDISVVECQHGIWLKLSEDESSVSFSKEGFTIADFGSKVGVYLYFLEQWRLVLDFYTYVGSVGLPGDPVFVNGYLERSIAIYTSGQNICFYVDPVNFNYQETIIQTEIFDIGGDDPASTRVDAVFPSTAPFQTVLNAGFNA